MLCVFVFVFSFFGVSLVVAFAIFFAIVAFVFADPFVAYDVFSVFVFVSFS